MKHIREVDYLELIKKETMRTRVTHFLAGVFSSAFLLTNSVICVPLLIPPALLKLVLPFATVIKACTGINSIISVIWITNNTFLFTKILGLRIETDGEQRLSLNEWYMVISNYQSWTDIIALQTVLNRKIPPLVFFIKKELILVPILWVACRALDFPFIKRYSRKFPAKNPHMEGKATVISGCAGSKFSFLPVSIMNFAEGTMFAGDKHYRQRSPYNNLLNPKTPVTGFVLTVMGEQLNGILDITIKYMDKERKFWSLLCGRVKHVKMHIERIPMPDKFRGDYTADPDFRKNIGKWLNDLWKKKDRMLEVM